MGRSSSRGAAAEGLPWPTLCPACLPCSSLRPCTPPLPALPPAKSTGCLMHSRRRYAKLRIRLLMTIDLDFKCLWDAVEIEDGLLENLCICSSYI